MTVTVASTKLFVAIRFSLKELPEYVLAMPVVDVYVCVRLVRQQPRWPIGRAQRKLNKTMGEKKRGKLKMANGRQLTGG